METLEALRSKDEAASQPGFASMAEALARDPGLAQRLDAILAWDARLVEAMRDVPVPPGLAEQILQGLEDAGERPTRTAGGVAGRSWRRRRFAWAAVAAGIGVAAVVIAAVMLNRLPTMSPEWLRSVARDRSVVTRGTPPTGATAESPPDRFPYSTDLLFPDGVQWRRVADFDRAEAVAYDIPMRPGQKATLYVVRCRSDAPLPTRVPGTPQMRTQGLAVSAWQGAGVVYVLVVEGDEADYGRILKSRAQGLA